MADAQIDIVPVDFNAAERQLVQATKHHASAQGQEIDSESAYILLYSAAHKAASVLAAAGQRVSSGERAHAVLLSAVRQLLGLRPAEQEHCLAVERRCKGAPRTLSGDGSAAEDGGLGEWIDPFDCEPARGRTQVDGERTASL